MRGSATARGVAWTAAGGVFALATSFAAAARSDEATTLPAKDEAIADEREREATEAPSVETETETETETSARPVDETALADAKAPSREELNERIAALEGRVDELELGAGGGWDAEPDAHFIEIYGFFDVTFSKFFVDEEGMFNDLMNDNVTFLMQHLNIYFASQLSESWSTLVELRFSFLPLGQEKSFDMGLTEYERVDTTVHDPYSDERIRFGGVAIERAHATWRPTDWFGLLAGRFLTPYGIWNIDHGSTVLIPIRPPLLQVHQWIPTAQTGLQIFGRFFPGDDLYLDYAVTASNGRGPIDSVFDLDRDKGIGLRARLTYDDTRVRVALGGYGYTGRYTDVTKSAVVEPEFHVTAEVVESYREVTGAGDLLLEVGGLRLQGEVVRGRVYYDERPPRSQFRGGGYQPDYAFTDAYGLLAYELPLDAWLGDARLAPYFLYEWSNMDDSLPKMMANVYVGGLNLKPTPFVTVKAEYSYKQSIHLEHADFQVASMQLAVSF